jgi:hypothetical protein
MQFLLCLGRVKRVTGEWCRRWTDWFDFLGKNRPGHHLMGYEEARKFAQDAGIEGKEDYRQRYPEINEELKKAGKLELPSTPDKFYKDIG